MSFVDIMLENSIVMRSDETSIEELLYNPTVYREAVIEQHKQLVPAMFKAMDALAIEGIESQTFLCLKIMIFEEMRTNKKIKSYDECADIYMYMVQVWGDCRLESGILKDVPESEREQAAKDYAKLKLLENMA